MIKQINWKQIKITLKENKLLKRPFLNFIENWIKSGFIGWDFKPMWDFIGNWCIDENKNAYQELQILANTRDY